MLQHVPFQQVLPAEFSITFTTLVFFIGVRLHMSQQRGFALQLLSTSRTTESRKLIANKDKQT